MPNINEIILQLLCRTITRGVRIHAVYEQTLPLGPKVFACNHPTSIDLAYCYRLMDYPVALVMKWGLDIPILGPLMRKCGFIPVGSNSHSAYSAALNELLKDRNVYICPEGKLSEYGARPKTGAVRLSIQARVPIIPVGIRHYGRIRKIRIGRNVVKFMPVGSTRIRFGAPIDARLNGCSIHAKEAHWVTARLMRTIKLLSE